MDWLDVLIYLTGIAAFLAFVIGGINRKSDRRIGEYHTGPK